MKHDLYIFICQKIFLVLVLALLLFFGNSPSGQSATPSDAIAIRIIPNPQHYSASRWYTEQNFRGAPQALTVDGYEAIRDGRTVYVNVANVTDGTNLGNLAGKLDSGDKLYTNIFVISFNQDAQAVTVDIFGQLLSHWKLNSNLTHEGTCKAAASQACTQTPECSSDDYCFSDKAILIRETRRLSDLIDLRTALYDYKQVHGLCPKLGAGSYLTNKTVSVWPSWQQTLGGELAISLPVDPINKLGACTDKDAKSGNAYSAVSNSFCLNDGATFTGSCQVRTWDYAFTVTKAGLYDAFIESTNADVSANGSDLSKLGPADHPEDTCPQGGVQHHIKVYLSSDGVNFVYKGDVCNDAVKPTDAPRSGSVPLGNLQSGNYTVRYDWDNDWNYAVDNQGHYQPGGTPVADSNIRIHKVGIHDGSFNQITCWSETQKTFADPTPSDATFNLPNDSYSYVYTSTPDGKSCSVYANMESGLVCSDDGSCTVGNVGGGGGNGGEVDPGGSNNSAPIITCGSSNARFGENFTGYVSAYDSNGDSISKTDWTVTPVNPAAWSGWQNWQWKNGVTGLATSATAVGNQIRVSAAKAGNLGNYQFKVTAKDSRGMVGSSTCAIKVNEKCGDGVINGDEQCDDGNLNYNDACDSSCHFTIKTQSISDVGSYDSVDGVLFDNNNDIGIQNSVDGGQFIKMYSIQPTFYAWLADTGRSEVVKVKVLNLPGSRSCTRSASGVVTCKIDPSTGEKFGHASRFSTGGTSPSRTAVNVETGDVWVHNRVEQTVVHFDNEGNKIMGPCKVDLSDSAAHLGNGGGLAIDQDGNAWAGNHYTGYITKFSASATACDGARLKEGKVVSSYIYGMSIDSKGSLWISRPGTGETVKVNPDTLATTSYVVNPGALGLVDPASPFSTPHNYGITVDPNDRVWHGIYAGPASNPGGFAALDANSAPGTTFSYFNFGGTLQGTAVSNDIYGRVWMSGHPSNNVYAVPNTITGNPAAPLYSINSTLTTPYTHGISGTSEGLVFSLGYTGSGQMAFYNAANGTLYDLPADAENKVASNRLDVATSSTALYTYADMAGLNRAMVFRSGTWVSNAIDSGHDKQHWGKLELDINKTSLQTVDVFVGAADCPGGCTNNEIENRFITQAAWNAASQFDKDANGRYIREGRYLKIMLRLRSTEKGKSPAASNIRIIN